MLESMKGQFAAALPKHLTPERMIRVALTAWRTTPALQKCSPASIVAAVTEASQLGLEPDGILGYAYLVPFGDKCTLIPGYKGLIDLARRSGKVSIVEARVVREGDEFSYSFGLEPDLTHRPVRSSERGEITHVYAIFKLIETGEAQFEVMDVPEIEAIRAQSRAKNNGPWKTHWEWMAKKTVLRQLLKLAPLSVEVHRAVAKDEAYDAGFASIALDTGGPDPEPIHEAIDIDSLRASEDPNRGHGNEAPSIDLSAARDRARNVSEEAEAGLKADRAAESAPEPNASIDDYSGADLEAVRAFARSEGHETDEQIAAYVAKWDDPQTLLEMAREKAKPAEEPAAEAKPKKGGKKAAPKDGELWK